MIDKSKPVKIKGMVVFFSFKKNISRQGFCLKRIRCDHYITFCDMVTSMPFRYAMVAYNLS